MDSDPIPESAPLTSDAPSSLHSLDQPKEMLLRRYDACLKNLWTRVTLCAAAFATSATLLLAVLSAFYSVSSEPMLADSPEARAAVAGCEERADSIAQQRCVRRLVTRAEAQDAGASQVATLAAHRPRAGQ